MGGVKFCKDCKWQDNFLRTVPSADSRCRHPEFGVGPVNLVTGEQEEAAIRYCRDVRADEALCGEHAKWFEPK